MLWRPGVARGDAVALVARTTPISISRNGPAAAPIASFPYETVLQEDVGMQ